MVSKLILLFTLISSFAVAQTRYIEGDVIRSADRLKFWTPPGVSDTLVGVSATQTLENKSISGASNTVTGLTNSTISATAAIDWSKMLDLTANRALVSNGSGDVSATAVTDTELGYLSGATSNIQAQIDAVSGAGGGWSVIGALDGVSSTAQGASATSTTLYMQSASASAPGLVNTTTQTFAGNKTFSGNISLGGIMSGGTVSGTSMTITSGNNGLIFQDSTNPTRKAVFNFGNLATGTTRTFSFPNTTDILVTESLTQTLTNKTVSSSTIVVNDNVLTIQDNTTPTKKAQFNVSLVTAGNTRSYDLPDANGTIPLLERTQTFTQAQTFSSQITVNNTIKFPATQTSIAEANTFDDYEEGTWTITISGSSVAGTGTYTTQLANYTKIGNTVLYRIYVGISAHTGSGTMRFNLPFTSSSSNYAAVTVGHVDNMVYTSNYFLGGYVETGATYLILTQSYNGVAVSTVGMDTSFAIMLSGHFKTD